MNNTPPLVSIGVPVYNGENYLRSALESLRRQTFENFEVLISDNASSDSTAAICREFVDSDDRFKYERRPSNIGAAANYNRTFEMARGRYFKWLAHDDWCEPTFLERCLDVFEQSDSSCVLVYTDTFVVDPEGRYMYSDPDRLLPQQRSAVLRLAHTLQHLNMVNAVFGLMRSDALADTRLIGPFVASDYVLIAELSMLGTFEYVDEELSGRRWHPAGSRQEANPTLLDVQAWFDGGRRRRFIVPTRLRLPWEYIRSSINLRSTWPTRLSCALVVVPIVTYRHLRVGAGRIKRRLMASRASERTPERSHQVGSDSQQQQT